jgi:hypothetical protein
MVLKNPALLAFEASKRTIIPSVARFLPLLLIKIYISDNKAVVVMGKTIQRLE